MPGQFNLNAGGSKSPAEYNQLVAEMMKRYGGDRDRAVRSANQASGFGSSTAQRFMHGGGGAAAAPAAGGGAVPTPTPRPDAPAAAEMPIPQPRPGDFASPDLAVSPPRGDMMWPGAPSGGVPPEMLGRPAVPMSPAMSMASILRSLPPELINNGLPGMPPFKAGLGHLYVPPGELADRPLHRNLGNNGGYPAAAPFG